jgi:transposase
LEALRTADGQRLAPCLRAELLRECLRLRQVMEMVAEVQASFMRSVWTASNSPSSMRGMRSTAGVTDSSGN